MIRIPKRYITQVRVPGGYKKYLKDSTDPISRGKLFQNELELISVQRGLPLIKNTLLDINSFWQHRDAPYKECIADVIAVSKVSGDGIAYDGDKFITVPNTLPGDQVKVSLRRHYDYYIEGYLIEYIKKSQKRITPRCKHFNDCTGCQLQHMSYQDQLQYKKSIIQFAFSSFNIDVSDTVGSPLQYLYRTKLTPHYDNRDQLRIGFNNLDNKVMDIDNCKISTSIVNEGLALERQRLLRSELKSRETGTLLIREHFDGDKLVPRVGVRDLIMEKVNNKLFQFPIYTFFQNNNSILPVLLQYIEGQLLGKGYKNLIDTYCGSGFFSISLSKFFEKSIGIEISDKSIEFAKINADLNQLSNVNYITGTASNIFSELQSINPLETCILIDPSRKGSTELFMRQLSEFQPRMIIYVSCNVYSQSRDLDYFMNTLQMNTKYLIKDVTGFDFFPQTKHVESVAVVEFL